MTEPLKKGDTRTMQFVYQGFTHEGDVRSFHFHGIEQSKIAAIFSINVDLPLLAKCKIAIQVGPEFCLHLLTAACASDSGFVAKLRNYRIVEEDLRPLILDREQRAALKALKPAPRRAPRKPSVTSQFRGLNAPQALPKA